MWKSIIKTIAPVLGTALGGPFGGMAAKVITGKLLGEENATDDLTVAQEAIANASPSDLLKLKEADNAFKLDMKKLNVDVLKIDANDRNSARRMQTSNKSWVVPTLGVLTVGGFFAVIGFVLTGDVPKDSTITGMVIGAVGSKAEQVYNFFFGSSQGSKSKTDLLNKK